MPVVEDPGSSERGADRIQPGVPDGTSSFPVVRRSWEGPGEVVAAEIYDPRQFPTWGDATRTSGARDLDRETSGSPSKLESAAAQITCGG